MDKYTMNYDQRQLFCAVVLLDEISKGATFTDIEPYLGIVLSRMASKGLIEISSKDGFYDLTDKGSELLNGFFQKYDEYLKVYDIYCAVDLQAGEFAFAKFFDLNDAEWGEYINQARWDDVRVAVAEFKKIDPVEIVFMAFLNEGKLTTEDDDWQSKMMDNTLWDDIIKACNVAIHVEELTDGDAITNIVTQGSDLMMQLLKKEKELKAQEEQSEEVVETTTVTEVTEEVVDDDVTYYGMYLTDPYYVSACWGYYYWNDPYWW